ncbi:MAG: hypothetical protein KAR79_04720 [Simkaniaceae bacterium]|nr:hypothetical protein [Simkaniaceae bacterium]
MAAAITDFKEINQLKDNSTIPKDELSHLLRVAKFALCKQRNHIQLNPRNLDPRLHFVLEMHFPEYSPYDGYTAIGELQNLLNQRDPAPEAVAKALQNANEQIPGLHEYIGEDPKDLNTLKYKIETALLGAFHNLPKEFQERIYGDVYTNSSGERSDPHFGENHLIDNWQTLVMCMEDSIIIPLPEKEIPALPIDKPFHGNVDRADFGRGKAVNFADDETRYARLQNQSSKMRNYYWISEHDQKITGTLSDSLLIKLPTDRRHCLPLSVQNQIADISDEELLLDIHLMDATDNARHRTEFWRIQFMMHSVLFPETAPLFERNGNKDLRTDELNPLQVGLFEQSGMRLANHIPDHDKIPFDSLRQQDQIIHPGGVLSPPNMQVEFERELAKFYFVAKWRDPVKGKKALVSLYYFDPEMNQHKGRARSLQDLPADGALKSDPYYEEFRALLGLS